MANRILVLSASVGAGHLRAAQAVELALRELRPSEIIASLRRRRKIRTPQITVTTDFETHRAWVHEPCERYCTATGEGAAYLAQFGVEPRAVTVTGIPIHPVFSKPKDRDECRKRQQLGSGKGSGGNERPVVLQLAGGFGVGPIEKLFRAILEVPTPVELVAVAGRNEKVRAQLERVDVPARHRAKVLGFTDQIDELMAAADIVVTKPGGLTSSEVLARGAAMVIVNPIPGQESRNSDYLLENGAAIKANNLATLSMKLTALLNDRARLDALKSNARRIAKPQAAFDVARMALDWRGN